MTRKIALEEHFLVDLRDIFAHTPRPQRLAAERRYCSLMGQRAVARF
jgi:hypothetical protein